MIAFEAEVSAQVAAPGELGEFSLAPILQTTLSRICEVCNLRYNSRAWSYNPSRDSSQAQQGPISVISMVSSKTSQRYHHPPISAAIE